jgi:hypothetical protein
MPRFRFDTAADADQLAGLFARRFKLPMAVGSGAQERLEILLLRQPLTEPPLAPAWRRVLNKAKRGGMSDPRHVLYIDRQVAWARWLAGIGYLRGQIVSADQHAHIVSLLPDEATPMIFAGMPRSQRAWRLQRRRWMYVLVTTALAHDTYRLDIVKQVRQQRNRKPLTPRQREQIRTLLRSYSRTAAAKRASEKTSEFLTDTGLPKPTVTNKLAVCESRKTPRNARTHKQLQRSELKACKLA